MGTRGYRVYRHRGYYFIFYNHSDSYPSGLGYEMASWVPSDPDAYKRWLEDLQTHLDEMLASQTEHKTRSHGDPKILSEPPVLDLFIEWIYELDLDHEVFLVNNWPVFDLKNMPHEMDVFTDSIGEDSYGNPGYSSSTPEVHRFKSWQVSAPAISPAMVARYESRNIRHKALTFQELFGDSKTSQRLEEVRIRFLEVLVGTAMTSSERGFFLRRVECIPDVSKIPRSLVRYGSFLLGHAVNPGVHEKLKSTSNSTVWLSSSVCLRMATHLTDTDVLQAAVADILDFIADRPNLTGVIYGLVFSFLHCVIVRVDVNTWTIDHTRALSFLPSFYGNTPSTPGITGVARIGCLLDPLIEIDVAPPQESLLVRDLPCEVWSQVADHLFAVDDLISMGHISPFSWSVANTRLKHPHVGSYRLLSLKQARESELSASIQLWAALFNVKSNKGVETLEVTGDPESWD